MSLSVNLWKQDYKRLSLAGFVIVVAVVLSMFNHSEISAETWTYWFFSRVLAEEGEFIVHGRSPLYTLYLNAFRWMDYPASVSIEYLVTTIFTVGSLAVLFKRYLGLWLAVFAAVLWIPFLQVIAEPPTQKIALALTCLGVVVRQQPNGSRLGLAVSYALLALAPQFRALNFVPLIVFAAWDIFKILKQGNLTTLLTAIRPQRSDWPIALVVLLVIGFVATPSSHPWNNVWAASTTWFPSKGKSISEAVFIQDFNRTYIREKYGSFEGKDFYFTNQELFAGAGNVPDAIRANPRFVLWRVADTIYRTPSSVIYLTELGRFRSIIPYPLIVLVGCLAILYGAFRATRDETIILFIVASVFQVGAAALLKADPRVFYIVIPTLVLSAYWYGTRLKEISASIASRPAILFWTGVATFALTSWGHIYWLITETQPNIIHWGAVAVGYITALTLIAIGKYSLKKPAQVCSTLLMYLATPLMLILLCNGLGWASVMNRIVNDVRNNELAILEQREPPSMKASFEKLRPLIQDCRGIMSAEHTFIGAFTGVSLDRVYDIWEIPPFGYFNDSSYDGLRPERIDCVVVSATLATSVGEATNFQIRYQNYVRPYVMKLQKMGAVTYDIPRLGQLVKLTGAH